MKKDSTKSSLPDLISNMAKYAEHYITLHKVDPSKTYDYKARGFTGLPVIEITRHANKCQIGDTWMYIATPKGSKLNNLSQDEKLYVGAQTQDRMFRGDNMKGENFHHAEMRAGNGSNNLVSFLQSGNEVEIYRFSAKDMRDEVLSNSELITLSDLVKQPTTPKKHLGWWFEQYVLFREPKSWKWNSALADKDVHKIMNYSS